MQDPVSRLQLHHVLGLSKMTISNLVTEYIEEGVLQTVSSGTANASAGRRADLIEVVPNSLLTLGILIESSYIQIGIINLKGAILRSEQAKLSADDDESSFIRKMFMLIRMVVTDEYKDRLWGVGVSSIGPLDIKQGKILNPPYFNKIKDIDIVTPLKDHFNLPVYLENDVNVSGLAEMYFGDGQKYDSFVYVSVKAGIGSGIIVKNELFQGHNGFGGEIGHVTVHCDGMPCKCGNIGCLEKYASIPAILDWYAQQSGKTISDQKSDWISLVDGATRGDELCIQAIDRMSDYLAAGLVTIVNVLDPQCIFMGGSIGPAHELIIPRLKEKIKKRRFSPVGEIKVVHSSIPGISSFIGAAALVMEHNRKLKADTTEQVV